MATPVIVAAPGSGCEYPTARMLKAYSDAQKSTCGGKLIGHFSLPFLAGTTEELKKLVANYRLDGG
jgi:hypothetical protein